ncbi:MAG: dephospho-CoA kinase [bacterium]|nr:dephospho-CoA kinase [bacterium]
MKVGVTGGIGAGKSSVCRLLGELGALVIEADAVGHEAVQDPVVLKELVADFGADILDEAGKLNRRELGRRAFATEAGRKRLNEIVWPLLGRLLLDRAEEALAAQPHRPVVIDAALLVEWGTPKSICDVLVVVTAPQEIRVRRTMERMGLSEAEVEARMASQFPEEEKVRLADYVIVNDGSEMELVEKTRAVWEQIRVL